MKRKNTAPVLLLAAAAAALSFLLGIACGRGTATPSLTPVEPLPRVTQNAAAPLDLNTATAEELAELPGIGEKLAQSIVAYREANGELLSIYELQAIHGIGEGKMAKIAPYLKVS